MKKLLHGIVDFRNNVRPGYKETFVRLALGQAPDALFVACSDSRVAPNLFASTEPGDLFVVRNVGNIIPPCGADGLSVGDVSEAAAIEFSTLTLKVKDIIVCGHSECGAIRALLKEQGSNPAVHLRAWLHHAQSALQEFQSGVRMNATLSLPNHLSQLNVLHQLENLRTYPVIRDQIRSGKLKLHGWWFDIANAEVLAHEASEGRFVVIDEKEAERILSRIDGESRQP